VRVGISFAHKKTPRVFTTGGEHPNKEICITKNPQCKGTELIENDKTKCVFIILIFVNEF
jgi:hypothetical protein